jgi:nucleoid DNA-binding protein
LAQENRVGLWGFVAFAVNVRAARPGQKSEKPEIWLASISMSVKSTARVHFP